MGECRTAWRIGALAAFSIGAIACTGQTVGFYEQRDAAETVEQKAQAERYLHLGGHLSVRCATRCPSAKELPPVLHALSDTALRQGILLVRPPEDTANAWTYADEQSEVINIPSFAVVSEGTLASTYVEGEEGGSLHFDATEQATTEQATVFTPTILNWRNTYLRVDAALQLNDRMSAELARRDVAASYYSLELREAGVGAIFWRNESPADEAGNLAVQALVAETHADVHSVPFRRMTLSFRTAD